MKVSDDGIYTWTTRDGKEITAKSMQEMHLKNAFYMSVREAKGWIRNAWYLGWELLERRVQRVLGGAR